MILAYQHIKRGLFTGPRFCFTLFVFLSGLTSSFAELKDSPFCRVALGYTLNLDFDRSSEFLEISRKKEPANNFRLLAENYNDFLRVLVNDDPLLFKSVKDKIADRISVIEDEKDDSPYYKWVLGDLYFQQGILKLKFGEYLSGASSVKKSLNLLEENKKKYPSFAYSYKYLGVMHAAISSVPPEYQWISSLLGFRGTLDQGVNELRFLFNEEFNSDPFVKEAKMLYLFSLMTFDNPEKSKAEVSFALSTLDKKNPLAAFFMCSALMKLNRNEEVIRILLEHPVKPFAYLDYISGVANLNKLNSDAAKKDFNSFISRSSGTNYKRSAMLKLAWCEILLGNKAGYESWLTKIVSTGTSTTDEDKLALNEARKMRIPDQDLLKSRLLFDGGYYDQASEILKSSSSKIRSGGDKIEYLYRQGRICHKQKKYKSAKEFYDQTLKADTTSSTWFTASAALQLGLIYEEENNSSSAKRYFWICLDMDPPEYRASLHQKAKAGLSRVE